MRLPSGDQSGWARSSKSPVSRFSGPPATGIVHKMPSRSKAIRLPSGDKESATLVASSTRTIVSLPAPGAPSDCATDATLPAASKPIPLAAIASRRLTPGSFFMPRTPDSGGHNKSPR